MIDEARFLDKLRTHRVALADNALTQSTATADTAFTFGRAAGMNQGLRMAEQMLLEMLKDNEKDI